ncbi:MAG: prepilin-type N-terminal cleavage/methylation domain-containing protein [Gemmataceae bacterium]
MRKRRPGYTLLEVLLAMAIAVMLLAAVYSVIGYQLRQAQAGRDLIEQATLARAILNKIDADVRVTLTLGDPARFRRQPEGQSGGSGGGSGTGTSGTGTSGTGTSTTPTTGTGATGTNNASGANTSGTPAAGSSGTGTTDGGTATATSVVTIPLGVIGGANDLHLFGSKFPNEVYDSAGQVTCDQRRISYWIGDGDAGLCRLEQRLVTSEEGASTSLPGDVEKYVLAPEARSLDVSYFDGSSWLDSWDSTELGPDEKTPRGSPRAIKVRVGLAQPNRKDGELKYHTHVILIPTAGGTPPATTPDTAEAAATTTSPP